MTGYGRAEHQSEAFYVKVEIKSLNAKYFDLSLRSSRLLNHREMELRQYLQQKLVRGKVNVSIDIQRLGQAHHPLQLDEQLLEQVFLQLHQLADRLGASKQDLFRMAVQKTESLTAPEQDQELSEEEWQSLMQTLESALQECLHFRQQEGQAMLRQLQNEIERIEKGLAYIQAIEPTRSENIRQRLLQQLANLTDHEGIDHNRLEQEMIYYIERLDISEEKVRLANHISYFHHLLAAELSEGKKLAFLCQEIGREINTIGAKAANADIQQTIVDMKDALERIKEQLHNIL